MLEPEHIIATGGLLLIIAIIFSESGLLLGFFLPGDTLLFAAGFFASQGKLSLALLFLTLIPAAVLGYWLGYHIGNRLGPKVFKKEAVFLKHEYIEKAEQFYAKHGGKATMLARFVPVVRTIAPVMAGAAKMNPKSFWFYNITGAVIWVVSVTLLGYWLGERIPNIDAYLLPIVLCATLFSFAPTIIHIARDKAVRQAIAAKVRRLFTR